MSENSKQIKSLHNKRCGKVKSFTIENVKSNYFQSLVAWYFVPDLCLLHLQAFYIHLVLFREILGKRHELVLLNLFYFSKDNCESYRSNASGPHRDKPLLKLIPVKTW